MDTTMDGECMDPQTEEYIYRLNDQVARLIKKVEPDKSATMVTPTEGAKPTHLHVNEDDEWLIYPYIIPSTEREAISQPSYAQDGEIEAAAN